MRFEVLGPVRAVESGRELGPVSELRRKLLAHLLVRANRSVSVEVLCEELWGDDAPRRPVNSLHLHVHRLRQVLPGPDRLLSVPGGYLLEVGPDELDAWDFARLHARARCAAESGHLDAAVVDFRQALGQWRGDAYADVDQGDCVGPEARRLAEARMIAREELYDAELDRGSTREIVPELTSLVARYPLRERFTGQLMLALYRSGRQARALTAYRAASRRLGRDLRTEPGPELRRLYEGIRAGDQGLLVPDGDKTARRPGGGPAGGGESTETGAVGEWAEGRPETPPVPPVSDGWAPRAGPRPAQLPPASGAFVGRERELERLEDAALGGGLVVITGMAGAGKTGLAVRFAHGVAGRFGDGQLYLDLRGHASEPALDPLEALGHLLRGLGAEPSRARESVAEAAAEYRSLLNGRKTLVLLDNAASAEQVRPLLPAGPGCLTLVTSRNRLSGLVAREGAERLSLGELPASDARDLLARILGPQRLAAEPDRADALIGACAGLPLALRIAAAQLADEPHRPVKAYVAELRERGLATLALDDDESSAVAPAFDLSYQRLDDGTRRVFRLLGLVPGLDFTADAVAALCRTNRAGAQGAIRRLAGAHLVDEHTAGRYRFHDLLRGYARHRVETEEPAEARAAALERLFAWYYQGKQAATAHRGSRPRQPSPPVIPDGIPESTAITEELAAIRWLRAEFPNIAAAVRTAADRPELSQWTWHLTVGLVVVMAEHGYVNDVRQLAQTAVVAARAAGDRHALANALTEFGAGRHRADLPVDAALVAEALQHAEHVGDRPLLAYCLNFAAVVHKTKGELDVAERYLTRSLGLRREDGDKAGQARALDNLGLIAYQRGDLRGTERRYEEILELAGDGGSRLAATALPNLIWARVMLGKVDGIDELIERAEAAVTRSGHNIKAHLLHLYRTIWYRDTGRRTKAFEQAEAAVRSADALDQPVARSDAHYQLGLCQLGRGALDAARSEFGRAFALADTAQVAVCLAPAVRGLAETELAADRLSVAESHAAKAVEFARRGSWSPVQLAGAIVTLARIELAMGRPRAAIEHGEDAMAINHETGHFLGRARAHKVIGEAYHATGAKQASDHLREALRMFEAFGSPEAAEVSTFLHQR